jgi:hypothetical protein
MLFEHWHNLAKNDATLTAIMTSKFLFYGSSFYNKLIQDKIFQIREFSMSILGISDIRFDKRELLTQENLNEQIRNAKQKLNTEFNEKLVDSLIRLLNKL